MLEFLKANWSDILAHIAQHAWLVFLSTAIAILIALPLGILITRRKSLRGPVLGIANVMQTIPSLALFGFLIPLPFIGGIGPRTAIVALVFYALLPIIRNTVTGILGIDKSVREAAVAMGMTDAQVLLQVELPLAMSVILTGVRVAVVITIGVAIIAAEVVAQMLEAQNVEVDRRFDLGGNLAHSALVGAQIDLYPEYTGTAFTAILHHQPITDPKAVYYQVKTEYSEQFNLDVSPPLGFDNT